MLQMIPGSRFKKRKMHGSSTGFNGFIPAVETHLSDLKLHTAEALSIPQESGSEQAGLLTYNSLHLLPAFGSG